MSLKAATLFALIASVVRLVFGIFSMVNVFSSFSSFDDRTPDIMMYFNFGVYTFSDLAITLFFLILFLKQQERES